MLNRYLFVLFMIVSLGVFSQRYSLLSYNTAEGLPQSQVNAVTQDHDGYLWVGTFGGLARFNGKEFFSYTSEDGLLNNRVTAISIIEGKIWVGHEGGISLIDGKKILRWAFSDENKTVPVTRLIDFRGRIIAATNGAGLFELKEGKLIQLHYLKDEDHLRVRDLMVSGDRLYIGSRAGVSYTKDLGQYTAVEALNGYSISGMQIRNNVLYVTAFLDGLLKYSLDSRELDPIKGLDTSASYRNCFFDKKGAVWLISNKGVFRLKNDRPDLYLSESNGLPMASIRCAYEDKHGNIWMGSEGKGLLRFPGESFVYYNESTGLLSDLIVSVDQDQKGNYWIGTYDKGLMIMDSRARVTEAGPGQTTVWTTLLNVGGFNWIATGSGLICMKGTTQQKVYYNEDGLPGDKITTLFKLGPDRFLIGGSEGVSIYEKGNFYRLKHGDIETVRDFCRIGDQVFCATDKGLFLIQNRTVSKFKGFSKRTNCLAVDDQKQVWIGTEEGLYRYDGENIVQITISRIPSSNFIAFLKHLKGKLFVGTNNGLFELTKLERIKPDVRNFGLGEGMVNLETNLNSGFIDALGRLWFGTASGLVCYRPGNAAGSFSSPQIVLKNILINYQSFDYSKYSDSRLVNGLPANLVLPHNRNNITFEIDGISLANYPGLKFQYWLQGQDEQWSPLNANTTITFNGLPAGEYILLARAVDSKGNVSEVIRFPFTVRQAFYRSWWFIGLMVLLVAFIGYRYFQFRLKREREQSEREKLEYRSRLLALEQKSLNASMNRHFIFNSLNSIQYFINTQDRLSANRFLTNFAKLIRKNLDSSDDGNMVPLSQELERLELYMSLESMRFKDRFDYRINVGKGIDTESVIIPAMMLQPFIENSIIHGILPDESKKGLITLDLSLEDDILTIHIEDNGVGIENSIQAKADYSGDHRSQGMEITSKRIDLLRKLSGRMIELIGPVQMLNPDSSVKGTSVTLKIQVENLDN